MLFVPIKIVVFGSDYQSVGKHITVFEVIDCFVSLYLCLSNIKPLVCFCGVFRIGRLTNRYLSPWIRHFCIPPIDRRSIFLVYPPLNVSYLCRKWTVVREIPYNGFYDSERIFILTL